MDVTVADLEAFARVHLLPLGLNVLVALVIFIVGRQVSRIVLRALDRMMDRSGMDVSLRKFLGDVVYAVPTHICPTCAMHRSAYVVENGKVVDTWDIVARDRMLTV